MKLRETAKTQDSPHEEERVLIAVVGFTYLYVTKLIDHKNG